MDKKLLKKKMNHANQHKIIRKARIQKEEFVKLCSYKDRMMLVGKWYMPYQEYLRLDYLIFSLGYMELEMLLLMKQPEDYIERILEEAKGTNWKDEVNLYTKWLKDFVDQVKDGEIRRKLIEEFQLW